MKKLLLAIVLIVGCDEIIAPEPDDCNGVSGGSAVEDPCGRCTGGNTGVTTTCMNLNWIQIGHWEKRSPTTEGYDDGIKYYHQSFYLGGSDYNSCESVVIGDGWPYWVDVPTTAECGWEEDEDWAGLDTDDGIGFDANYVPWCDDDSDIKSTIIHYYVEQKYVEYFKLGETENSVFDIEYYENNTDTYCGVFVNYEVQ